MFFVAVKLSVIVLISAKCWVCLLADSRGFWIKITSTDFAVLSMAHFSRTPSWSVFHVFLGVFRCYFWFAFGAEGCSRSGLGDIAKMMEKRSGKKSGNSGILGTVGGGYNNNLWSVAILGHSASRHARGLAGWRAGWLFVDLYEF